MTNTITINFMSELRGYFWSCRYINNENTMYFGFCYRQEVEEVGVAKQETFIQERLKTEQVNNWTTIQKVWLQTWSSSCNVQVAISFKIKTTKTITCVTCYKRRC